MINSTLHKAPDNIRLEPMQPAYDNQMYQIIREVLTEIGENKEGTVFVDPSIRSLSTHFNHARSMYRVVLNQENKVLGGCGIAPLEGYKPESYCELQRMFLLPEARATGASKKLMEVCLDFAKNEGYTHCYIETMESMQRAVHLYQQFGFKQIPTALGNTGHFSCTHRMLKTL